MKNSIWPTLAKLAARSSQSLGRGFASVVVAAALGGCEGYGAGPYPIENSTWLISRPETSDNSRADVNIEVFSNRTDCENADPVDEKDLDLCVPAVDRGHGQVRFSFMLTGTKGEGPQYLSLNQETVDLAHFGVPQKPATWDLIPHDPRGASQLFILVLDGSASIYTTGGIKKVKEALLDKQVMDSFLPKGQDDKHNGVLLLRFSEDLETIDGKDPYKEASVLERQKDYAAMIETKLENRGKAGFSHVYEAVTKSATKLLEAEKIRNFLASSSAEPTIVLLTDGFNNIKGADVCADNVPRLKESLDVIQREVAKGGKTRMRVFTIGLGTALNPGFKPPPGGSDAITDSLLCSNDNTEYPNQIINGDLELQGIDNQSLYYIAQAGNGESYVRRDAKGLAEVFIKTAAKKYEWYTIFSEQDPYFHRRSFDARVRLKGGTQGEATVHFYPSPWLDAPTGTIPEEERWFVSTPFRAALGPLLMMLGALSTLRFVGPAWFNTKRALFRRPKDK
jgi:hypothetical protein